MVSGAQGATVANYILRSISSSHTPCTSCMFVDSHTLEVEDLVLANGG